MKKVIVLIMVILLITVLTPLTICIGDTICNSTCVTSTCSNGYYGLDITGGWFTPNQMHARPKGCSKSGTSCAGKCYVCTGTVATTWCTYTSDDIVCSAQSSTANCGTTYRLKCTGSYGSDGEGCDCSDGYATSTSTYCASINQCI